MKYWKITIVALVALIAMAGRCELAAELRVGAERTQVYVPLLKGKRVGLLSNHTGMVGHEHTLDVMLREGVNVTTLFSPEHGFRGDADAGAHVASGVDGRTGLPIISLYGGAGTARALTAAIDSVDVVVVDIQDVGLRFYTYYITMLKMMNAAAQKGKEFVVLDRPNPNGMTVDGPILDMRHASGVGQLPIPVVHGMTLGELAKMIVGEGWLDAGRTLQLKVVACEDYTHATRYELPVAPSPNLRTMRAIYLYPSLCLFEGTLMSLGRGTERPYEMYGHPNYSGSTYSFTPRSMPGAVKPPLLGRKCYGRDLGKMDVDSVIARGLDLTWVIDAYRNKGMSAVRDKFFTSFFTKLIGNEDVARRIRRGESATTIRASWQDDVAAFRRRRAPYLLYPEQ